MDVCSWSRKWRRFKKKAVPIEKLLELLESNIGEKTIIIENPEINSEIAKGSESSYSVEDE